MADSILMWTLVAVIVTNILLVAIAVANVRGAAKR